MLFLFLVSNAEVNVRQELATEFQRHSKDWQVPKPGQEYLKAQKILASSGMTLGILSIQNNWSSTAAILEET